MIDPKDLKVEEPKISDLVETLQSVKCCCCGALHEVTADTFLTFYGNVCVGTGGGIIGNNMEGDVVYRASIFCRKRFCLQDALLQYVDMSPKDLQKCVVSPPLV